MKKFYSITKKINSRFLLISLMICGLAGFSLTVNAQYGTLPLNGSVSGNLTPRFLYAYYQCRRINKSYTYWPVDRKSKASCVSCMQCLPNTV